MSVYTYFLRVDFQGAANKLREQNAALHQRIDGLEAEARKAARNPGLIHAKEAEIEKLGEQLRQRLLELEAGRHEEQKVNTGMVAVTGSHAEADTQAGGQVGRQTMDCASMQTGGGEKVCPALLCCAAPTARGSKARSSTGARPQAHSGVWDGS